MAQSVKPKSSPQQHSLVLGLGLSGQSAVRHLAEKDRLTAIDSRTHIAGCDDLIRDLPQVNFQLGQSTADLDDVDRVIVSPGLPMDHCLVQRAQALDIPLLSDVDLFCAAVDQPLYAITGTNGKSTVTSLVAHLLNALGQPALAGGNLGVPALDLLAHQSQMAAFVLELSSFQLERMQAWPFAAATILNLSEDHIDHHGSMATYVESKRKIYTAANRIVVNRDDELTYPNGVDTQSNTLSFGQDKPKEQNYGIDHIHGQRWLCRGPAPLVPCAELPLAGRHNEQNVLASLALLDSLIAPLIVDGSIKERLRSALQSFSGLEHRCELVCEHLGVRYVNDSKATNVGATQAALTGLGENNSDDHEPGWKSLVLLLGGDSKGADLSPLVETVVATCSHAVLYGACRDQLVALFAGQLPIEVAEDFAGAVTTGCRLVTQGQTLLLSPACASFDEFSNFSARGDAFRDLVLEHAGQPQGAGT